jgi:hypothetical protein
MNAATTHPRRTVSGITHGRASRIAATPTTNGKGQP